MKSGKVDQYKELTKFIDVKNFNSNMEQWWIDIHQNKTLTKSEIIALKRLVRFSFHIPGICYAKIQTVVAATHEYDGIGVSKRTFERMLKKSKAIGLVDVIHTHKANGKQSHNVYVFSPYVVPNVEKIDVPIKSINLPTSNLKEIRTEDKPVRNQPTFVSSWVNKQFAELSAYFFEPKQVEDLYRISIIHGKQFNLCSVDVVETSIQAIKTLVTKMKTKPINNPNGFYNGIIKRKMKARYLADLFNSVMESA